MHRREKKPSTSPKHRLSAVTPQFKGLGKRIRGYCNRVILEPIMITFAEPVVLVIHLYGCLLCIFQFLWLESFAVVFTDQYGFDTAQRGLAYLGIVIGAFVTAPPLFWWFATHQASKFDQNGRIVPEERLPPAMVGCLLIPIGLFSFGWTASPTIHWIVPILGSSLMGSAMVLLCVSL